MKLFKLVFKKFARLFFVACITILSVILMIITKPASSKPNNLTVLISGLLIPGIVTGYATAAKNRIILIIGVTSLILMIAYTTLTLIVLNIRLY